METFFQNYFALQPGESVDIELVQTQADQARQCTTYMCPHVSPLTLQRAAAEGTVQRNLLSTEEEKNDDDDDDDEDDGRNNSNKIFLYYDEGAVLKRRERNERACRFVKKKEQQQEEGEADAEEPIYGDVFLVLYNNDGKPKSLNIAELSTHTWFSE